MHEFKTSGTCSKKIHFDIKDNKVHSLSFDEGCNGNLKALGILVEGMDKNIVIEKLKGIHCRKKNTSCADQLAKALENLNPPSNVP